MKGKLILTDISSPIEGMKAIFRAGTEFQREVLIRQVSEGKVYIVGSGDIRYYLSELKQIVVEYEEVMDAGDCFVRSLGYHTLPLHPDDWKWAIEHIGEEVEFKSTSDLFPVSGCAKLIHPTPVTYTEEEVKDLFYRTIAYKNDKAAGRTNQKPEDWWNEHKKK